MPAHLVQSAVRARETRESHLALLTREAGVIAPLDAADAQRTSELVEAVVAYLATHSIEPPMMPSLASRMLELLRDPDVDVPTLARLIERDPATAAKLLSVANSAVYKGPSEVASIRDAIMLLGTEEVARIAIALATRTLFEGAVGTAGDDGRDRWSRLFGHAMTTAFAACQLATQKSRRHSEAAFLGGLFHDVGKAVALRALTEMMAAERRPPVRDVVLDSALHLVHSEPTCVMYERWRLPRSLMTICTSHHRLTSECPPELHFVRLVSGLDALRRGSAPDKAEALAEIEESAAALRLSDAELRVADNETRQHAERVQQMLR